MKKILILALVFLAVLVAIDLVTARKKKEPIPTPSPSERSYSIKRFTLSESSYNGMAENGGRETYYFSLDENSMEIETTELGKKITIKLKQSQRENLEQALLALIELYSLQTWDGYDESMDVLDDGHSFTLNVVYADGTQINARGDHMFPDDYRKVFEAVQSAFANYKHN